MADSTAGSSRDGQVQVHFITNSPDIELPEEKRQLLVPTSKSRTRSRTADNSDTFLTRRPKIWVVSDPQFGVHVGHILTNSI